MTRRVHGWKSAAFRLALAASVSACSPLPAPPPMPQEVAALAAQYDAAAAKLDPQTARTIFMQTQPLQKVLSSFTGLLFFRDVIDNATSVDPDSAIALDVQGTIDAHAPCPGWSDDKSQGFIDVTLGVEATRVQRAFIGHATQCHFVTQQAGTTLNVVATMDLQVDLGSDIGLGDTAPAVLVRATNVSGAVDGLALDLAGQVVSFRLDRDSAIETLVDLTPFHLSVQGSVLLVLQSDGTWSLRTRSGEWICDSAGSAPCMAGPAAP
jgi:hypothetical protein